MGIFETVSDPIIKKGDCTDIYFLRTEEILEKEGINPQVAMEVTAATLPDPWGVFCGLRMSLPSSITFQSPLMRYRRERFFTPMNRCSASRDGIGISAGTRP